MSYYTAIVPKQKNHFYEDLEFLENESDIDDGTFLPLQKSRTRN